MRVDFATKTSIGIGGSRGQIIISVTPLLPPASPGHLGISVVQDHNLALSGPWFRAPTRGANRQVQLLSDPVQHECEARGNPILSSNTFFFFRNTVLY